MTNSNNQPAYQHVQLSACSCTAHVRAHLLSSHLALAAGFLIF